MLKSPNIAATPAKKVMMTLVGGAGIVLLGGGAIIFGMNSKLTSLQTAVGQTEKEVGSSEQIAQRYQVTRANFTETQSRIQFLESAVTPKSYVPTLLKQLQTLAQTTHLTVTSVRPGPPPAAAPPPAPISTDGTASAGVAKKPLPPPYDVVPIDVDVTGNYADTATFLYDLTRFPKIVAVVGAQMHPNGLPAGSSPTASPMVTTNLHLVAFMFHDDSATPAPESPAVTAATPIGSPGPVDVSKIDPAAGRVERGALAASQTSGEHIGQNRAAVGSSSL